MPGELFKRKKPRHLHAEALVARQKGLEPLTF